MPGLSAKVILFNLTILWDWCLNIPFFINEEYETHREVCFLVREGIYFAVSLVLRSVLGICIYQVRGMYLLNEQAQGHWAS